HAAALLRWTWRHVHALVRAGGGVPDPRRVLPLAAGAHPRGPILAAARLYPVSQLAAKLQFLRPGLRCDVLGPLSVSRIPLGHGLARGGPTPSHYGARAWAEALCAGRRDDHRRAPRSRG